jgi:DNA-binding transcriptional LysR family regulator
VLSIGCSNESYLPLLTDLLEKCRNRFPEIHPFFRIIPFRAILNLFVRDEVDILFGFKDDIPMQEDFCYKELIQIPVCFAMPKNHPLAQQKSLTEQDVLSEHIVICDSYEMPSEVKDMQAHIRRNLLPDATNYCENLQTMLTLIRAGYGIGLLPEIPSADPTIKYIHIEPKLSLSYGLFYRESSGNPITKKFLSLLHF